MKSIRARCFYRICGLPCYVYAVRERLELASIADAVLVLCHPNSMALVRFIGPAHFLLLRRLG